MDFKVMCEDVYFPELTKERDEWRERAEKAESKCRDLAAALIEMTDFANEWKAKAEIYREALIDVMDRPHSRESAVKICREALAQDAETK